MFQLASSLLIWMFRDRNINSKINVLHYRALKIVYSDSVSSFDKLLIRDESLQVHSRNIYYIAIEMFIVKLCIAPSWMAEIFLKMEFSSHSVVSGLRNQIEFSNYNNPETVYYG